MNTHKNTNYKNKIQYNTSSTVLPQVFTIFQKIRFAVLCFLEQNHPSYFDSRYQFTIRSPFLNIVQYGEQTLSIVQQFFDIQQFQLNSNLLVKNLKDQLSVLKQKLEEKKNIYDNNIEGQYLIKQYRQQNRKLHQQILMQQEQIQSLCNKNSVTKASTIWENKDQRLNKFLQLKNSKLDFEQKINFLSKTIYEKEQQIEQEDEEKNFTIQVIDPEIKHSFKHYRMKSSC